MGRGLSQLQKDIMEHAQSVGYISPQKASELTWETWHGSAMPSSKLITATSSRALRRLVRRGLLVKQRLRMEISYGVARWNVYQLPEFKGEYNPDCRGHRVCSGCALSNIDMKAVMKAMAASGANG
jgi:hypothetical protein